MRECSEHHQDSAVDLKSLRLVLENHRYLPGRKRSAKNRPSQTRRKALVKRKKRDQADATSSKF